MTLTPKPLEYASNIQPQSITVHTFKGRAFVWRETHPLFEKVKEAIRARADLSVIEGMMDVVGNMQKALATVGNVTVTREGVAYKGKIVRSVIADRILAFMAEGAPVEPLMAFLDKLLQNPRKSAVDSLFDFIEANNIPLYEDGDLLVYKRVRGDYKDIHSGTFDNSVGTKVAIEPWEVDEDRDNTCSNGLHVCARQYLPSFGAGSGNRVVICKVSPASVVAVPRDYNNSKMRVFAYDVVGELTDADAAEALDRNLVVSQTNSYDNVEWDNDDEEAMESDFAAELAAEEDEPDYTDDDYNEYDDDMPATTPDDDSWMY